MGDESLAAIAASSTSENNAPPLPPATHFAPLSESEPLTAKLASLKPFALTEPSEPGLSNMQLKAGRGVEGELAGGADAVGGVQVKFDEQAGGEFTSQYFQTNDGGNLIDLMGETAFNEINFRTVGSSVQGWELHFDGDFEQSVQVSLTYDDSLLPEGFDESKLQIMHFVSELGYWEIPEDLLVDPENNLLTFSVTSFSPMIWSASRRT